MSLCLVNCSADYVPTLNLCLFMESHVGPFPAITCFTFTQLHTITPGSWPLQQQSISAGHRHSTGSTVKGSVFFLFLHSHFSHKALGGICFGNLPVARPLTLLPSPAPQLSHWFRINTTITWQAPSNGARSVCRAFCSVPGRARRPGGRRSPLSSHGRSPSGQGSAPDGGPETRWRCGMPSCHWAWCTWEARGEVVHTKVRLMYGADIALLLKTRYGTAIVVLLQYEEHSGVHLSIDVTVQE